MGEKDESEIAKLKKEKQELLEKINQLEYSKESTLGQVVVASATNVAMTANAAPTTPLFSLLLEITDSDTAKTLLIKGGSALSNFAACLKIATQVYQNWNIIEDAEIRGIKIQETITAVKTAYESLKIAQRSFRPGTFEERLLNLKIKDYEKKLDDLDRECRKNIISRPSANLSSILVLTSAMFLSSGEVGLSSVGMGLGVAANYIPSIPLGGEYINPLKKWAYSQYSQVVDKLYPPSRELEERRLLEQTAERLGLEASELEEELEIIVDYMTEKDKTFVREILTQAGIKYDKKNIMNNLIEWLRK